MASGSSSRPSTFSGLCKSEHPFTLHTSACDKSARIPSIRVTDRDKTNTRVARTTKVDGSTPPLATTTSNA